ncbi:ATP-binding cassette domain-containing protein [Lactiplantibacillus argentoratensis]|uniref:ABC transporter ATP-binding protein n=1 Tax=Lactiplantibacillus argentoratensis TaxID=271881 RepID=A0AAN1Q2H1_9LACO|nr:ABC transporter ATP-binding protein [Lactiplantibacillus argentoratensis]AYJ36395.1 ABC transporter ATP-binding protein [Lactiplantibacillus argentoratensis]KRL98382.1 ABC superfamily ATP binding cassette transporter, ABC protein [Lactiplantibacillus argentoratensis DSM 16365]GEO52500.1 ABC transporter ATP-binding protein [Lactiplantibacillus argentoratensis]
MSIQVQAVQQAFRGQTVLDNLNLTIKPNTIYGLLGRNGAGKSTLLNIISNRIFADSGTVTMDNKTMCDNDHTLGKVYLMSEVNLYSERSRVKQLFKTTALLYGDFDDAHANKLAQTFGLDLNACFGKLSTGYRTILKLIIALCVPADYVFLDEPVLGLDANHREIFYQELIETYSDHPRTFVISTHLIEEIANLIEHVFVLDNHHIIVDGDVTDILGQSYAVTGPQTDVSTYTDGLNIIGQDHLGGITAHYVYGPLNNDRPIPDTVTVEHLDLQKLFVNLTNTKEEAAAHVN